MMRCLAARARWQTSLNDTERDLLDCVQWVHCSATKRKVVVPLVVHVDSVCGAVLSLWIHPQVGLTLVISQSAVVQQRTFFFPLLFSSARPHRDLHTGAAVLTLQPLVQCTGPAIVTRLLRGKTR